MLRLKLQYFVHLLRRVDSLEKTLMLGGIGGRRRRGRQRLRWLDGITNSMAFVSDKCPKGKNFCREQAQRDQIEANTTEGRFLRDSQTGETMTVSWEWRFWRVIKLFFPLQQFLS